MLVQHYGRVVGSDWDEQLDDLRWHYGEAYLIHYLSRPGRWVAQRRDSHATMSAESADGLLGLIREDYRKHPVSRATGTATPDPRPCRFLPEG
jgi:hypothetical protein